LRQQCITFPSLALIRGLYCIENFTEHTARNDGILIFPQGFKFDGKKLYIPKIGWVSIKDKITKKEVWERIKEILRATYGNEVVNRIIAILYSAGIDEVDGNYVKVVFKDGVIDSVKIVDSQEEKDNTLTFRVKREGMKDELEKKIYDAINEMKFSFDHNYWKAYRRTPEVLLKATLARLRGIA